MLWDPLNAWPAGRRWLWASLAVLVCIVQGPAFLSTLRPERTRVVDFFRNWAAARFVLEGQPAYAKQDEAVRLYSGDPYALDDEFFIARLTHPPFAVLAALPFAGLDYPDATLAWNLFSLGCLGVSLWLIGRGLGIAFPLWGVFPLVTLAVICHPLREQLLNGQLNLVLLLLIVGTWAFDREDRPVWAGIMLGTATALKLFPGFLLIYFLMRRRWAAVGATMASFALLTTLSLPIVGLDAYRTYFDEVVPHLQACRGLGYNVSLVGFWSKLFEPGEALIVAWQQSPNLAQAASLASCLAVTSIVAWLAWRLGGMLSRPSESLLESRTQSGPRKHGTPSPITGLHPANLTASDHAFAAAVTAMLLVTPTVWHHYFVLLALPLAVVWRSLPPTALARGLFMLIGVLFWFHPMLWWQAFVANGFPGGIASPGHVLTVLALQTYALLVLFGMGFCAALRAADKTVGHVGNVPTDGTLETCLKVVSAGA